MKDNVNSPQHYTQASITLEPIDVLRYAPFDLGNALKYIIRAGHKGDELEDLLKALKYIGWAEETCSQTFFKCQYEDFITNYGLFVKKFKAVSNIKTNYGANGFIEDLKILINKRIEEWYEKNHLKTE